MERNLQRRPRKMVIAHPYKKTCRILVYIYRTPFIDVYDIGDGDWEEYIVDWPYDISEKLARFIIKIRAYGRKGIKKRMQEKEGI